ncbi:substrate-binding domain-containing protein [Algibacter lectus]|nr:substrate-binding domain-containing protein [Algibacter lectus]GAL64636.1 LacI family transcriptional regulator [Algibacter lectus]
MKHTKELQIKIPDAIAFVGFSNEPVSSVIEPSLTTIDQSGFEIGKIASELMLKQILTKETPQKGQTILIDTHLIERNSSKK